MELCLHCAKRPQISGNTGNTRNTLCDVCIAYPRCEVCDVIFGEGFSVASNDNPNRCESCINFEDAIDFFCSRCKKKLRLFYSPNTNTLHNVVRGNWCGHCNSLCAIESHIRHDGADASEFSGYLALLNAQLLMGRVTQGQFDEAKYMNPHDWNRPQKEKLSEIYLDELGDGLSNDITSEIEEIISELGTYE